MTLEDDLDELYGVPPEAFTARRKELAAAAKKRGDKDAAKVISAARRPTVAAWVVNTLVRADATARQRLSELTDALRAAHAAMDGPRIRELTSAQRKLVNELGRTAFGAAGITEPTGALRDDVAGTLQAAIADPEVGARLGRLEKAEQWSGFGDFGLSAEIVTSSRREPARKASVPKTTTEPAWAAAIYEARRRRDAAAAALESTQASRAEADEAVAECKGKVATARRRYEKLLETLSAAEQEVAAASGDLAAVERSALRAVERLKEAEAELIDANEALAALTGGE